MHLILCSKLSKSLGISERTATRIIRDAVAMYYAGNMTSVAAMSTAAQNVVGRDVSKEVEQAMME